MSKLSTEALDQAVANGTISAAQRKSILKIAGDEPKPAQGRKTNEPKPAHEESEPKPAHEESEPLEIFHGFAEIFVTIGLGILLAGIFSGLNILAGETITLFGGCAASLGLAYYYVLRRHMLLPSILLTLVCAVSFFAFAGAIANSFDSIEIEGVSILMICGAFTFALMGGFYKFYKVPFAMFTMGLAGAVFILGLTMWMFGIEDQTYFVWVFWTDPVKQESDNVLSVALLGFGVLALIAAMRFDMTDPHRIARASKCAFWLHLLAGPALINAVIFQSSTMTGALGHGLTFLVLLVAAIFALITDRRSFLTAGIIYLGALIGWATTGLGEFEFVAEILLLGVVITGLGTWWHKLRSGLFTLLPSGDWRNYVPPVR